MVTSLQGPRQSGLDSGFHFVDSWFLKKSSLRGKRLKGKVKGVLGARETRGARAPRVSLAPKTPFPFPFKRLPRRLEEEEKSLALLASLVDFLPLFRTKKPCPRLAQKANA